MMETDRPSPWDATESIALIANNNGKGCVLACHGRGIVSALEDTSAALSDCGLDNAPEGLSIWEGHYDTIAQDASNGRDYDAELRGQFRNLTRGEWLLLQSTGFPWKTNEESCPSSEP